MRSKDEKVEMRGGVGAAAKLEWMKLKSGGRKRRRKGFKKEGRKEGA